MFLAIMQGKTFATLARSKPLGELMFNTPELQTHSASVVFFCNRKEDTIGHVSVTISSGHLFIICNAVALSNCPLLIYWNWLSFQAFHTLT